VPRRPADLGFRRRARPPTRPHRRPRPRRHRRTELGVTAYAFPTHDDRTLVGVNLRLDAWRAARADIAGEHLRAVAAAAPALAERLAGGRREERWVGAATPGFFRRSYGPGWALVGDAGYTKDPCTAQGISDAFRQAEWLVAAIDDGLTGRRPMHSALAAYQQERDVAALPTYEFTCDAARMEPSAEMGAYLASLQGDPAGIERFFGVFAGTVRPDELFGAPAAA
jgi:flavin-dependent dehydrogenase